MLNAMAKRKRKRVPTFWNASRLRELRLALTAHFGWTQAEIAEQVGVSDRQWRNWETDSQTPAKSTLILIGQLNVKLPVENRPK